jgi:4-amino-4-deoxy-L-arabinose transferase-like glycosyltransferase
MRSLVRLQKLIFQLEEGPGKSWLRFIAAALALLLIVVSYNWFCFRNMGTQEAMDCAQLARNIAEGNGFTTLFVRPLSMRLLQNRATRSASLDGPWQSADPAQITGMHPDIANAPVYPLILAGLMKVLPFDFRVDMTHRFWSSSESRPVDDSDQISLSRAFRRYQPDFLISAFNQVVLLVIATLSYFLARRLFDLPTAVFSTVLLLGTESLWRFAVSGLPTLTLLLIFVCLVWCLVRLENCASERDRELERLEASQKGMAILQPGQTQAAGGVRLSTTSVLTWAALAGVLVALGALTRYPFAWLILPVLVFIQLCTARDRLTPGLVAFLGFAIVFTPWLVRNWLVSGSPFGTAAYATLENGVLFPGSSLQRLLKPDLELPPMAFVKVSWLKLLSNGTQIVQNDLPRLGGSWVASFFVVGLVLPSTKSRIRRLGYFLALSLFVLAVVQALGQTQLSTDSPGINSENLLVVLVPAIWIYGTRFFFRLLRQFDKSLRLLRPFVMVVFGTVTCLPLIVALLTASRSPVVFPPYYPPSIQSAVSFVKSDEMMMSDIPWAVAWYGHAQCVWLTQTKRDFFNINDHQKPIQALYLSHATGGEQFQSFDRWLRAGDESWGDFIMSCVLRKQQGKPGPPADFPLEYWQKGWPMFFLLTSREKSLSDPEVR